MELDSSVLVDLKEGGQVSSPPREVMDLELSLPDDVLAGVLRRLSPRCLAASRGVCKAWRRVVDTHRLLRADLLPLSLGGIFFNCQDMRDTQFLSRPTTDAAVSGELVYTVPHDPDSIPCIYVKDHCNGLLLLRHCVVNPATRQWALLPSCSPEPEPHPSWGMKNIFTDEYLAFDPTLSPHFELLMMPDFPVNLNKCDGSEWPPSTLKLSVFSSKIHSWEERTFSRDRVIATTLPGMFGPVRFGHRQCGYWRGALYICCSECFVMRISLSDNTYQVIRFLSEDGEPRERQDYLYLGKSDKGIYCASFFQSSHLQLWFLNDQTEWVLKHDGDLNPIQPNLNTHNLQRHGPWILQEFDYWNRDGRQHDDEDFDDQDSAEEDSNEAVVDEKFDWDSDNDNVLEPGNSIKYYCSISFHGFHPLKEVVFLMSSRFDKMLAYNWSTSKLQDLGKVFPKFYTDIGRRGFYHNAIVTESFPYTPCWLWELPEKLKLEAQLED